MANKDDTRDSHPTGDDKPTAYEVGYGRPPKETRFQPGQSGNPKGRPKKRPPTEETFEEMFMRISMKRLSVPIRGRQIEIPKIEAIMEQMYAFASQGKAGALKEVILLMKHCAAVAAAAAADRSETRSAELTETDQELIERHFRRRSGATDDDGDDGCNGGGREDA